MRADRRQVGRQGFARQEDQALQEDRARLHLDPQLGQLGNGAVGHQALVQDRYRDLHDVGLEALGQQDRLVVVRRRNTDARHQALGLQLFQPRPQGVALGAGQVLGAVDQGSVDARQAHMVDRAAQAAFQPVQALFQAQRAHLRFEGGGERPAAAENALDIAVIMGRIDVGNAAIGGQAQDLAHFVLAHTPTRVRDAVVTAKLR